MKRRQILLVLTALIPERALHAGSPSRVLATWRRAIRQSDVATLRRLLERVGIVDTRTRDGKTALMIAAGAGDPSLTERLLAAGADPNARNANGGTALMYAVTGGNVAVVRRLLATGTNVNAQSNNGWNALMLAAAKGLPEIASALCQAGANPAATDVYGWTPLMRAVYEGRRATVLVLLKQADSVLERRNDRGQSALHLAVIRGDAGLARLLLQHGASQFADAAGDTPRSIAETLKRPDLVKLLAGEGDKR